MLVVDPPVEVVEGLETIPVLHVSTLPRPEGFIPPPETPVRKEKKSHKKARKASKAPSQDESSSGDEGIPTGYPHDTSFPT